MSQAVPQSRRLTFKEYLKYDDGTDTRYELVDGKLWEVTVEQLFSSAQNLRKSAVELHHTYRSITG